MQRKKIKTFLRLDFKRLCIDDEPLITVRRFSMSHMEEWKRSPSFPCYEISTRGRIRGPGGKPLASRISYGHDLVGLYSGPQGERTRSYHRVVSLVAETYLDDWDSELDIEHLDGDPRNNCESNLRMVIPHDDWKWMHHFRGKRRKVERTCPETGAALGVCAVMVGRRINAETE